jgi:hypothetical protein
MPESSAAELPGARYRGEFKARLFTPFPLQLFDLSRHQITPVEAL